MSSCSGDLPAVNPLGTGSGGKTAVAVVVPSTIPNACFWGFPGHTSRELCCNSSSSSSRNIVTRILCLRKTTVGIDVINSFSVIRISMVSIILFTPLVAGSCIIDNSHTLLSVFLISGTFCSASSSSPSSFRRYDHFLKIENCSHPFRRVIFHREKSIYRGISSRASSTSQKPVYMSKRNIFIN